jgi:hypothetical protein
MSLFLAKGAVKISTHQKRQSRLFFLSVAVSAACPSNDAHMARRQRALGLSETQLRERLNNQLEELHILPEHRVQPSLQDPERPGEASA